MWKLSLLVLACQILPYIASTRIITDTADFVHLNHRKNVTLTCRIDKLPDKKETYLSTNLITWKKKKGRYFTDLVPQPLKIIRPGDKYGEELQNKKALEMGSNPLSGRQLPFSSLSDKLDDKKKDKK